MASTAGTEANKKWCAQSIINELILYSGVNGGPPSSPSMSIHGLGWRGCPPRIINTAEGGGGRGEGEGGPPVWPNTVVSQNQALLPR